jgi:hypothetical protein
VVSARLHVRHAPCTAIRALLPVYQRWGELKVRPTVQQKLLALSAATAW